MQAGSHCLLQPVTLLIGKPSDQALTLATSPSLAVRHFNKNKLLVLLCSVYCLQCILMANVTFKLCNVVKSYSLSLSTCCCQLNGSYRNHIGLTRFVSQTASCASTSGGPLCAPDEPAHPEVANT